MSRKLGAQACAAEEDPLVDLVGDDPRSGRATVREQRFLLGAGQGPAGRVVGRIDEQDAGAFGHRVLEGVDVEPPRAVLRRAQREADDVGAEDRRLRGEVGPDRDDGDHFVAGPDQRLHRQHQRADARRRHGDAAAVDGRMQRARVAGDGFAQLGEAEVVRIEGLALGDRPRRGVADELRRRLVALAEPEREHVAAAHRRVRDLADLRSGQVVDQRSHGAAGCAGLEKKNAAPKSAAGSRRGVATDNIVGVDHVRSSSRARHRRAPQPCPFHLVRPHRRPLFRRVVRPLRRLGAGRPRRPARPLSTSSRATPRTPSPSTFRAPPAKR